MECGSELIVAADGGVAICAKCGKSYTFTPTVEVNTPPAQIDPFEECKSKVLALMELEDKHAAFNTAEHYLDKYPQDYRAYLLCFAIKFDMYKLDPVDAVIEETWSDAREFLEDGLKIAKPEERAIMKAECGEYCKRAENVVQIFYDMKEFAKVDLPAPIAPIDPEIEISGAKEHIEKKIALERERLDALTAEYEAVLKRDDFTKIYEENPLPKFFITKKIVVKRRIRLINEVTMKKTQEMKALSDQIEQYKKDIANDLSDLEKLDEHLSIHKPKYLESYAKYKEEFATYEKNKANYDERKAFFDTDPVALAIQAKIDSIKVKIAEQEGELKRLEKQSTPFSFKGGSQADYFLDKAVHRENEKLLSGQKAIISGKIRSLQSLTVANKPKAPFFED
jgi:hypothetical protein